ncbi:hypothetical protein ACWN8V_06785 [Vagococcus elongatus]|uniref:Uncharacterized protein n=1 Tax=Vagococcus elongatus TaxID=180344 RepID=A0A430AW08_9ENTE|nr:hypothetical protein [Vagococcus elongatus]RSU12239.1 hypothetical protein CBF29_06475 [Vagococcus elongatus]
MLTYAALYVFIAITIFVGICGYAIYEQGLVIDTLVWSILWIIAIPLQIYYYYIRLAAKRKLMKYTGSDWISVGMAIRMKYKKPMVVMYTQIMFTRGSKLKAAYKKQ